MGGGAREGGGSGGCGVGGEPVTAASKPAGSESKYFKLASYK